MITNKEHFRSDQERFEYTFGMGAAFRSFCVGLINLHPAPESLLPLADPQDDEALARRLANVLENTASEALLKGIAAGRSDLLSLLQSEMERRAHLRNA
jgi:hypothetical protein